MEQTPGQIKDMAEHTMALERFKGRQPRGQYRPCSTSGRFIRRVERSRKRQLGIAWEWTE